jgi:DmsE family decaheme c-type cytochrome
MRAERGEDRDLRARPIRRARSVPAFSIALAVAGLTAGFARGQTPPPAPSPTPGAAPAPAASPAAAEAPALCGDCHEDQAKAFSANPHARMPERWRPSSGSPNSLCESCHGDGTKHIEAGGDKPLIRGFHTRGDADTCLSCHLPRGDHSGLRGGIHTNSETVRCATCHSVHSPTPKSPHLLSKAPVPLCASCHPVQTASLQSKPFAHRLGRGGLDCTSCHDPHGRPGKESLKKTRDGEQPCLDCHAEKRGPFVFEHPPKGVVGDCTTCHQPHGSMNPKQLTRANVFQLCLECHSTLSASTLGSQPPSFHNISLPRYRNCTTCHVAIHGSNLSPTFFK